MNRSKELLALIMALLLGVSCAACADGGQDSEETSAPTSAPTETAAAASEDPHEYDIAIETEYGSLYYPDQWTEYVRTEQSEGEDSVTVSFYADINGSSYLMFTIVVGGDGDSPAGTLTGPDGTQRNVYVQLQELEFGDELSETEQNRLYAMQEDINYLLDSLE